MFFAGGGGGGCVIIESWVNYTYFLAALSLLPSDNLEVKRITIFKMHNHRCTSAKGLNYSGTRAEDININ